MHQHKKTSPYVALRRPTSPHVAPRRPTPPYVVPRRPTSPYLPTRSNGERGVVAFLLKYEQCITYLLRPLTPPGHRPSTTFLQRLLSWAILSSCCQPFPVCLMSASRSRRKVFFGLPLFLLPWGFHIRACLVMLVLGFLKVWPRHPHLFLRTTHTYVY